MRVLLVTNNYQITGGAEVFAHEIARVLKNLGHDVAFFCAASESSQTAPFGHLFPATVDYKGGPLLGRMLRIKGLIYSSVAKKAMEEMIYQFRPDLVHAFAIYNGLTPSVLEACREKGIPVVMSCNDYKHICPNYKLFHHHRTCEECKGRRFHRAVVNHCCKDSLVISVASSIEAYVHEWMNLYRRNVHTFLFASNFMLEKTSEFWKGASFRTAILRNPFDSPSHACRHDQGEYFLYFGRLIDEKGVDLLLKAMEHVPEAHLKIVGSGPDEIRLREQVRSRGHGSVEFLGALWGSSLDEVLQGCRAVVVPSLWHENFPYVILQAFAAGKAVIGSRRGGIPELIEDGKSGLLYDAADDHALADALTALWSDPVRAVGMGRAAKAWCDQEFNDETFGRALMTRYEEVLS